NYYSVFQTLGERFIMVRWPRAGGVDAAIAAMNQDHARKKEELKRAVHKLITELPTLEPEVPREIQQRIAAIAEIAVRGRTHVPREGASKTAIYIPEPESPTRLAQQLAQLAKGSALLDRRAQVTDADYDIVRRAATDCIPAVRWKILDTLVNGGCLSEAGVP